MRKAIELQGVWQFELDGDKKGIEKQVFHRKLADTIPCRELLPWQKRELTVKKEKSDV